MFLLATGLVVVLLLGREPASAFLLPSTAPSSKLVSRPHATGVVVSPINWPHWNERPSLLYASGDGDGDGEEEDEELIPGKMRVGEIKAELDLRGVSYSGIFERSELENLLIQARKEGKARPEILDNFNEKWQEQQRKKEELKQEAAAYVDDVFDNMEAAKAGDGTLPGGVTPEDLNKLTSNQEIMDIISNPRLQELMKAVMEKDSAKMAEYAKDTEIMQLLAKFRELAKDTGIDPTKLT